MTLQPIGSRLPKRRDSVATEYAVFDSRDRALEMLERERMPSDVKHILSGAISGNIQSQQLLFQSMMDTWPRLQKNIREVGLDVASLPWDVEAYHRRGERPDERDEMAAAFIEDSIWGMKADPARRRVNLHGILEALAEGYWTGHQVLELDWHQDSSGAWAPKAAKVVAPRFYGYDYEGEDSMKFDPSGGYGMGGKLEDFAKNKFLIAVNGGHSGHPTVAAPLRSLVGYWLAAVFGLKWMMQYSNIFGQPTRWANYPKDSDPKTRQSVLDMLNKMGTRAFGAFPDGTDLKFVESGKGSNALPQMALIAEADKQADIFILGQTLTSSTDGSGSRALGEVHEGVRKNLIFAIGRFVSSVISCQLIPAIAEENSASLDGLPTFEPKKPHTIDSEKQLAKLEGMQRLGMPVAKEYVYTSLDIPMPSDGAELAFGTPHNVTVTQSLVTASKAKFPKAFGSLGIPRSEMPQIKGEDHAAFVNFAKAKGFGYVRKLLNATSLRPTQEDYFPEGVEEKKANPSKRAVLASRDGYILDGHHQWKASFDQNEKIEVLVFDAPMTRLLALAHLMPSSTIQASEATLSRQKRTETIDRLMENIQAEAVGVQEERLAKVRPFFANLVALAQDDDILDEDFIAALRKAEEEIPELADDIDSNKLRDLMERAIASALLAGTASRYES